MTDTPPNRDGPRLQTGDERRATSALVDINLDELKADRRDPEWQAFLKRAKAYRGQLRRNNRLR